MKKARLPRSIILVAVIYLVAAVSAAIAAQNWDFLRIYVPFFIAIALVVNILHRRNNFSGILLWNLTIWGALNLAGGLITIPEDWPHQGSQPILHSLWIIGEWLKWDNLVRFFGFITCTWLIWESLRASIQARLGRKLYPSMGMIFLCIFAGMGLGTLTELAEFFTGSLLSSTVDIYRETCRDLIASSLGCLFAGILIFLHG